MSVPAPERLTIATCIGCGAMSVPSACPGGCGPERSLELVAGAELDELVDFREQSRRRAQALAQVLTRFMALPSSQLAEQQRGEARGALRAHGHDFTAACAALSAEPDPGVSWWCEHCGGLDAPAPCVGVCIRRPAQWATLEARQRQYAAATAALDDEQCLARAGVEVTVLEAPVLARRRGPHRGTHPPRLPSRHVLLGVPGGSRLAGVRPDAPGRPRP